MTHAIYLLVLLAAVIDALQHFLIKSQKDTLAMAMVIAVMGGFAAMPLLAVFGLPDPAAWPLLCLSVALGSLYWIVLGWSYTHGTLGMVFPVARGTGVLLTTLFAAVMLRETLTFAEKMMVIAVVVGLALIAFNVRPAGTGLRHLGPALILAVITAAFTITDGTAVRIAGSPLAYCAALYLGNAIGVGIYAAAVHRHRIRLLGRGALLPGLGIASLSFLTYFLILTAMHSAPIAVVAALAESSIVFAAIFGCVCLREPTRPGHAVGIVVVALGVGALRFA